MLLLMKLFVLFYKGQSLFSREDSHILKNFLLFLKFLVVVTIILSVFPFSVYTFDKLKD